MWTHRSLALFSVGMAIMAAIFTQMGLYGLHMLWDIPISFNLLTWCTHWMNELGLWSLIHLLNVLVMSTFFLMGFYMFKHAVRTMNVHKYIRWLKDDTMSKKLVSQYKHFHLEHQLIVISGAEPVALAFGMFRRRIVLSTGLIDMLDEQELTAVLYHEYYHLRHYDPLKTFLLTLSVSILGYVPILKNILSNYKVVREILADNYAIKQSGSAVGIGGALIKMIKSDAARRDHPMFTGAVVSPFAADVSINDRISRILEPDKELLLPYSKRNIAISLIVMTALSILFNYVHY